MRLKKLTLSKKRISLFFHLFFLERKQQQQHQQPLHLASVISALFATMFHNEQQPISRSSLWQRVIVKLSAGDEHIREGGK
jgi:hypothetical protein